MAIDNKDIKYRLQEVTKNLEAMKAKKIQAETEISLLESQLEQDKQALKVGSIEEAKEERSRLLSEIESKSTDYESILSNIKSVLGSLND